MLYTFSGKVIKGDGYGKKIGFPTINLDRKDFLKLEKSPAFGVYAGKVILGKKNYRAGIVIGPLDKKGLSKIEAHLIGYNGDAYGKEVKLVINQFLREYKDFETEEELINQIKKDINLC